MFHEAPAPKFIVRVAVGGFGIHRADRFLGPTHQLDLTAVVGEAGAVPRQKWTVGCEVAEIMAVERDQATGVAEIGQVRGLERLLAFSALLEVERGLSRHARSASAASVAVSSHAACVSSFQAISLSAPSRVATSRARPTS